MPSPVKTLCIFGDSHLPCLKYAIEEKRVDLKGIDVAFYGAGGGAFVHLAMSKDGEIFAKKPALEQFKLVNGKGRERVSAGDYDAFLFHGIRLRSSKFFVDYLNRMNSEDGFVSRNVRQCAIANWLQSRTAFGFAAEFAKTAKVLVSPAPFETQARGASYAKMFENARFATSDQRLELNAEVAKQVEAFNIEFIPQCEDTIVDGCFTDDRYAGRVETADGRVFEDTCHMNGEYGARVLQSALNRLL